MTVLLTYLAILLVRNMLIFSYPSTGVLLSLAFRLHPSWSVGSLCRQPMRHISFFRVAVSVHEWMICRVVGTMCIKVEIVVWGLGSVQVDLEASLLLLFALGFFSSSTQLFAISFSMDRHVHQVRFFQDSHIGCRKSVWMCSLVMFDKNAQELTLAMRLLIRVQINIHSRTHCNLASSST